MFFILLCVFALLCYLLGSIPFSYLAGKLLKGIDLREHGSGNLGATNTYRMLGFKTALVVGILDALKGFSPVLLLPGLIISISNADVPEIVVGTHTIIVIRIILGMAVISGHVWTAFLGFKGGKGVTTAFGVFLAIAPIATAASLIVWMTILHFFSKVSVASMITAILFPAFLYLFRENLVESEKLLFFFSLAVALLVIFTHRSNILRLMRGEEKDIKE
ncbi:MAG: glycerol-3-phosphate 1-O-acyltransferase PlsY [Candidatus Glassbacteria bacterium]